MSKILIAIVLGFCLLACTEKSKENRKSVLTPVVKRKLIAEFTQMADNDQAYRSFISFGTLNKRLIDSVSKLPTIEQINFQTSHQPELSQTEIDSLWVLQTQIDFENTYRLQELIEAYGWISTTQLDSAVDPMIFLFHTPKKTIEKTQELLFQEVKAQRMEATKFAMYVDNMRKKAFGKNQLYGTGDEFDPKTNTIVPPLIDNIDSTNSERTKIGLAKLKIGAYRTSK